MTNNILISILEDHTASLKDLTREVSEIRQIVSAHVAKEDAMVSLVGKAFTVGTAVTGGFIATLVSAIGWLLTRPGAGLSIG